MLDDLDQPRLGLATTLELLEEAEARYRMGLQGVPTIQEKNLAQALRNLIDASTPQQLDYRSVD